MGLHRRLAHTQLAGDLGVGEPTGQMAAAPRAPDRSAVRGRRGVDSPVGGRCSAKRSSSSRRVTEGARRASPAATTRMASMRSSGGTSFRRKPLAPARERFDHVLVEVEGREDQDPEAVGRAGLPARRRVASTPSTRGIRMSIRTTSGRSRRASLTASLAVGGLPDHLEVGLGFEDHPEAGADKGLIVDDEDANAHPYQTRCRQSRVIGL